MSEKETKLVQILRTARHKQELTQEEVAKKAGLTTNTYARIERGEQRPSGDTLRKLVKALDLDPAEVL